jgi:cell division protein FtsQ
MSSVFTLRRRTPGREEVALRRLLTALAVVLAVGLALYLLARLFALPVLAIRHVVVESNQAVSEQEVLGMAGLEGGDYYHSLSTAAIEKRLEQNPLVRRAHVQKVFPGTLRIVLSWREPVALVIAESEGRSVPLLVDREGFAFKVGSTGEDVDLPVISGISLEGAAPGASLGPELATLFSDLAALRAKSPSLYRLLSEVRVVSAAAAAPAPARREFLLYLLTSPVRIRAAGGIDDTLLKYSLMVIDLLSNQGTLKNIDELDFRGAEVVYRMKEE